MKKKNLLLMLLAVMALLLIPVSVQAAATKPGIIKLSSIILYIIRKPAVVNGLK